MSAIRDALRPLLAQLRTPAQVRDAAAELGELAGELHARAKAMQREVARPPAERISTQRGQVSKGGRPSTFWVQVLRRKRANIAADNITVRLSTSLYYAAQAERYRIRRERDVLKIIPTQRGGMKVMVNAGGVRLAASGSRAILPPDGKYAATINAAGEIEVGAPIPSLQ